MRIALRHKQSHLTLDVQIEGNTFHVGIDGTEHTVQLIYRDDVTLVLALDGQQYRCDVACAGRDRLIAIRGEIYHFVPESGGPAAHVVTTVTVPEITAPVPGRVLEVLVAPGDHVMAGDGLVVLDAMKMENRVLAEAAATVSEVRVTAGDMVDGAQVLVVLQYDEPAR